MTNDPSAQRVLEASVEIDNKFSLENYLRASLQSLPNPESYSARTVLGKPKCMELCKEVDGHKVSKSGLVERLIWIDQNINSDSSGSSNSSNLDQKIAVFALTSYEGVIELEPKSDNGNTERGVRIVTVIDKVDSTGFKSPKNSSSSVAKTIIRGYLAWRHQLYSDNNHLVYVFARAQPQYLFRNSASNPAKHILTDSQLIRWWKSVLSYNSISKKGFSDVSLLRKWFVPGMDVNEARALDSTPSTGWVWGTAYSENALSQDVILNLPDDAKSRLLNENDGVHASLPVKHFLEILSHGEECGAGRRAGIFYAQSKGSLFSSKNPTIEDLFEEPLLDVSDEDSDEECADASGISVLSNNELADVSASIKSEEDSLIESEVSLNKEEIEEDQSANASNANSKDDLGSTDTEAFDSILRFLMENADYSDFSTGESSTSQVNNLFDSLEILKLTAQSISDLVYLDVPSSKPQSNGVATINTLVPKRKNPLEFNIQEQPKINILTPKRKKPE